MGCSALLVAAVPDSQTPSLPVPQTPSLPVMPRPTTTRYDTFLLSFPLGPDDDTRFVHSFKADGARMNGREGTIVDNRQSNRIPYLFPPNHHTYHIPQHTIQPSCHPLVHSSTRPLDPLDPRPSTLDPSTPRPLDATPTVVDTPIQLSSFPVPTADLELFIDFRSFIRFV